MRRIDRLKAPDETLDTFFHGRILVLQKKTGYRFAVDAPLLADFIRTESQDECLELGTGCGIISLLLSIKPFRQIVALEIQERLAELARRNVRLNGLEDRIEVRHADLRTFQPGRTFDVVFSNPPYIKFRDGHLSSSAEKSVAKHEVKCDILDTMKKTAELLKKDGRAYFIFTARREDEFVRAGDASGLFLHRKRDVLPREGRPPNFFLSQCGFLQKATENLPPLVLFDAPGRYSQEAKEIFAGRVHGPFA